MNGYFLETTGTYYRTNTFQVQRPTIVFIHGLSGSSSAWTTYEQACMQDYNVLTYDIRGHGMSRRYPHYHQYAITFFVAELNELFLHLHIDHAVIVSHSFGTFISLGFIEHHREKVSGAVFLSPILFLHDWPLASALKVLLSTGRIFDVLPFSDTKGNHVDYTRFVGTGDWNMRRCAADLINTTFRVYFFCAYQTFAMHPEMTIPICTMPVLIIHGKNDTISPVRNAKRLAYLLPHASLTLLDDTDHIVVLNRSEKVIDLIRDFLQQL